MQEALPLIKPSSLVIDRVRNDPAGTGYFGRREASSHGVHKQCRADAGPLQAAIDCETTNQQQGYPFGHAPPQLRGR
jgi:hypothetical protein